MSFITRTMQVKPGNLQSNRFFERVAGWAKFPPMVIAATTFPPAAF
jgi:hypothetical protein